MFKGHHKAVKKIRATFKRRIKATVFGSWTALCWNHFVVYHGKIGERIKICWFPTNCKLGKSRIMSETSHGQFSWSNKYIWYWSKDDSYSGCKTFYLEMNVYRKSRYLVYHTSTNIFSIVLTCNIKCSSWGAASRMRVTWRISNGFLGSTYIWKSSTRCLKWIKLTVCFVEEIVCISCEMHTNTLGQDWDKA
jgi:hypothetical protein